MENSSYVLRPRHVLHSVAPKPQKTRKFYPCTGSSRVHRDYPRTTNRYNCSATCRFARKYSELEQKKKEKKRKEKTRKMFCTFRKHVLDGRRSRKNAIRFPIAEPNAVYLSNFWRSFSFPSWRLSGSELLISDYHSFTRHSRKNIISTHLCVDAP